MTSVHNQLVECDQALAAGARALEIAGRLGDLRLRILTTTFLVQAHHSRGDYVRVIELAADNLSVLPAEWVYEYFGLTAPPSVYARAYLAMSCAQLGRFAEGAEYEAKAIRLAEPTHHAFTIALAYLAASTVRLLRGDWARARPAIEHWIAALQAGQVANLLSLGVAFSAWALAQLGDESEALSRLGEAGQLLEGDAARGFAITRGWAYHALGRACLQLGRFDEAQRLG